MLDIQKSPRLEFKRLAIFFVGILGLEPRMTGPESVVLPLHHIPMRNFYLQLQR